MVIKNKYLFASFGTDKHQFNRLMEYIVRLSEKTQTHFVVQNGFTEAKEHKYIKCVGFVNREEFDNWVLFSDGVVCHAGMGAILTAIKFAKKKVIVPRQRRFGEHINDHQMESVNLFSKNNNTVKTVQTYEDFEKSIQWIISDRTRGIDRSKEPELFGYVTAFVKEIITHGKT